MSKNIFVILAIALFSQPLRALETDQYMVWEYLVSGGNLTDSTVLIDKYLNTNIQQTLNNINKKKLNLSCNEVVLKYLESEHSSSFLDYIEDWAFKTLEVAKYPDVIFHEQNSEIRSNLLKFPRVNQLLEYEKISEDNLPQMSHIVSKNGMIDFSLFRKPFFMRFLPMGKTIKLNGVHLGIDKLSHFLIMGMRYYKIFLLSKQKNATDEVAFQKAIQHGIESERTYYGFTASGVFSFADLESNFQGMLFAKDLCNDANPALKNVGGAWTLAKPLSIAPYVNAYWDESINPSYFQKSLWQKVVGDIKGRYCPLKNHPVIVARNQSMLTLASVAKSYSIQYLDFLYQNKKLLNEDGGVLVKETQSLENVCEGVSPLLPIPTTVEPVEPTAEEEISQELN